MKSVTLVALFGLLFSSNGVDALRTRMEKSRRHPLSRRQLVRRATVNTDFGEEQVGNSQDLIYTANITVGGEAFLVQIDTGSSDLWVTGQTDSFSDTGIPATLTYGKGTANGNISVAAVQFAGYSIPDQAYVNATDLQDFGNLTGIIGLGPVTSSVVRNSFKDPLADPFLDRVFASNKSTPNFLSFTLSRTEIPTSTSEITIGEIIPGLENVTSQPKNPVQILANQDTGGQHWSLLVDAIIGPDGKQVNATTGVANETKLVAVLDSGFSLPQVPQAVSDAFYGRVPGASFESDAGAWVLPCDQELNISFTIGGINYPVHPLDASLAVDGGSGTTVCIGAFQGNTLSFGSDIFDMILGDGFLRNTYTLIDYGDFEDVNVTDTQAPFIQLLSTTDPHQAHLDFVNIRLGGVDTTGDPKYALLPPGQGQTSPSSGGSSGSLSFSSTKDKVVAASHKVKKWIIIVASVVGGLVLLGLLLCLLVCCGVCSCFGRFSRRNRGGLGFRGSEPKQTYQSLNAPAPMSHPQEYGYVGKGAYE